MSGSDRERTWFQEGIEKNPSWYTDEDPEEELEEEEEQPQRRKQKKKEEEEEDEDKKDDEENEEEENKDDEDNEEDSQDEDTDENQNQDNEDSQEQDQKDKTEDSVDEDSDADYDDQPQDTETNKDKKDKKDKQQTDTDTNTTPDTIGPNPTPELDGANDANKTPFDKSFESAKEKAKETTEAAKEKAIEIADKVKDNAKSAIDASKAALAKAGEAIKAALAKLVEVLGPYIGWILLALLAIIIIIVVIVAVVVAVGAVVNKMDPANMINNDYLTSEYFYGRRIVYIDDEKLADSLELSYKQYVIDVVENFEENNPNIDIVITLPNPTGKSLLDNTTTLDTHVSNLYLGIANIVATSSNDYQNVNFDTLYPLINYFGFTDGQKALVSTFIANYIVINNLYSTSDAVDVISLMTETINNDADLQYMYQQYEKIMIKDEIATPEGLVDVEQRQYVASIYMPSKNIDITRVTYTLVNENEDFATNIKLIEVNNGNETTHLDNGLKIDNANLFNGFTLGKVSLSAFKSIDASNLHRFSEGLSLFEAIKSLPDDIQCFQTDAQSGVYTWKPVDSSALYLEFEANNKFIYSEFDMGIKIQN